MTIVLERVYGAAPRTAGHRVLVDRVWPRGVARASLELDEWCRELAPSRALRTWFAHDPGRWEAFRGRYLAELDGHQAELTRLREMASRKGLVLLYGARDTAHNQAVVLREALEKGVPARRGGKAENRMD
ncbi:MAG: DUF488 family protein [Lentisphaerae bacterium]|mgnify:CR=1 FL=1|nr:DUF488 family protein [Lentisphaerota bacterium]